MNTTHDLFDGSEAQELDTPVLVGDVVAKDCEELRDIAKWLDSLGHPMQGDFLRKLSIRHQYLFDGYLAAGEA